MNDSEKELIFHEERKSRNIDDLDTLLSNLRGKTDYLHQKNVDHLIEFFDKASREWEEDRELKKEFGNSLEFISDFLKAENLERMLDIALRDRKALDEFLEFENSNKYYHAQPRGLAVHWLAGNVPLLGIFSILQSVLTKNPCLVKVPSASENMFIELLDKFSEIQTDQVKGSKLAECIAVVKASSEKQDFQNRLSEAADVRVIWGSRESVESIQDLDKGIYTEDIIYGPKYSYAVISNDLKEEKAKSTAYKLAIDASLFDQYACSSPHTLFVEKRGDITPKKFAEILAEQMDVVNRTLLPKQDKGKTMEILKKRQLYSSKGEVFKPDNDDWTVIYSEENDLAEPCFSRVIHVRPVENLDQITSLGAGRDNIQTIGLAISDEERRKNFVDKATFSGADRCPRVGEMSFFESPWDGMFAFDRLVRWVTTYKEE